jgi:hypothetical protein
MEIAYLCAHEGIQRYRKTHPGLGGITDNDEDSHIPFGSGYFLPTAKIEAK